LCNCRIKQKLWFSKIRLLQIFFFAKMVWSQKLLYLSWKSCLKKKSFFNHFTTEFKTNTRYIIYKSKWIVQRYIDSFLEMNFKMHCKVKVFKIPMYFCLVKKWWRGFNSLVNFFFLFITLSLEIFRWNKDIFYQNYQLW
jgi:hypothetical protein